MFIKTNKIEDLNNSTVCVQPFYGLQVNANGSTGVCCEISDYIQEVQPIKKPFLEVMNAPLYQKLRSEMLNGEKPKECWRCYEKEKFGAESLRQVLNKHYFLVNKQFDSSIIKAQNIEIVLGNTCQLRCVMCHPNRSKNVTKAFKEIINNSFDEAYAGHVQIDENFDTDWVDQEPVWDHLTKETSDVKRLFFSGGEPLLVKQHERILQTLIDNNLSKDVIMTYSTNGFLMSEHHLKMWRQFRNVGISFSIDDLAERNTFIRNPSQWDKVVNGLENIKKWQQDPLNANIEFGIWTAINFLSFPYLKEFLEFFAEKYPSIPIRGWRAIQTPVFLSPTILPQDTRKYYGEQILAVIEKNPQFSHLASDIQMIIDMDEQKHLAKPGVKFMNKMGELYKGDVAETFPKLLDFIQQHTV